MNINKLLFTSIFAFGLAGNIMSQDFSLAPVPQEYKVTSGDSIQLPLKYQINSDLSLENSPARSLLARLLPNEASQGDFQILLGIRGDMKVKKYEHFVPGKAESYYLNITPKGITVVGADERGAYYGVQTLSQLLTLPKLPQIEIRDYPDIPYRGVVEGFYGTPWSHEARLRQLDFYGKHKMNTYIYGPKDDPYHRTPHWRQPYPEKEARQIKELVEKAKENNVIFYWAIHPGQDIQWNDTDRQHLMDKLESMYQLGVRGFAVFFDDIEGEGTKADKQAELLNYIDNNFVSAKGDVAPLILCPTEYNKAWSKPEDGYLSTLGSQLNKNIQVMWTGDDVVIYIDQRTLDFINPLIQRKAYIWWNYPVTDYVQDHLLMGPVSGNSTDISGQVTAFVSNPMEHAEASKIALYSIASYTWNMQAYDSMQAWYQAIQELMPQHAQDLLVFGCHNADLGPNRYNFRMEESWNIRTDLSTLLECAEQKRAIDWNAYHNVMEECKRICSASDNLLVSNENPWLIDEIAPWLIRFKILGMFGKDVLHLMKVMQDGPDNEVEEAWKKACTQRACLQKSDELLNTNANQPGAKVGSRYLLPTLEKILDAMNQ